MPPQNYLDWKENLEYRANHLKLCIWACNQIEKGVVDGKQTEINGETIPIRFITNAAVESGLVSIKAILDFIGIKIKEKTYKIFQIESRTRPSDVGIEFFGEPWVTLGELENEVKKVNPSLGLSEVEACLLTTNKIVVHSTSTSVPNIQTETLRGICKAVLNIFESRLARIQSQMQPIHAPNGTVRAFSPFGFLPSYTVTAPAFSIDLSKGDGVISPRKP